MSEKRAAVILSLYSYVAHANLGKVLKTSLNYFITRYISVISSDTVVKNHSSSETEKTRLVVEEVEKNVELEHLGKSDQVETLDIVDVNTVKDPEAAPSTDDMEVDIDPVAKVTETGDTMVDNGLNLIKDPVPQSDVVPDAEASLDQQVPRPNIVADVCSDTGFSSDDTDKSPSLVKTFGAGVDTPVVQKKQLKRNAVESNSVFEEEVSKDEASGEAYVGRQSVGDKKRRVALERELGEEALVCTDTVSLIEEAGAGNNDVDADGEPMIESSDESSSE